MAENKNVLEIKKRELKEELRKEEPYKFKVKRLKESIKRHLNIAKVIKKKRDKNWRKRWKGK